MTSDLLLLLPVLVALLVVLALRVFLRRKPTRTRALPPKSIVVDGSNVMHWGGDPSMKVLQRVIASLKKKGHSPIVFFDANVGYKLGQRYLGDAAMAKQIGLPVKQVFVVDKGVVADKVLLGFATDHALRVVSNDRFRDWRVQYPAIGKKGTLLRGTYRDGSVIWGGKRRR